MQEDENLAAELPYMWRFWAREKQLCPPGDHFVWFLMMGRGAGKTKSAAEWVREEVDAGRRGRWAFVSKDPRDARDVMIEGKSGIMNIYAPDDPNRPRYQPSNRRITWPNGARATIYSGEDPDALRGPEFDGAWADELAAWQYPGDCWDNLLLATRLRGPRGEAPRICVTTTPKPLRVLKKILADPKTLVVTASTYENLANLDDNFRDNVIRQYEGTRLGRQELEAEILEEAEGALWNRDLLDATRVRPEDLPEMRRIVVAIDPMASADGAKKRKVFVPETGIVVCGLGADGHGYVLADHSVTGTPDKWASRAIMAYKDWEADKVVAEVNQGGDMVEDVFKTRDPNIFVKQVRATRGKYTRAEPIQGLYEQQRIHHCGFFPKLEDQLCNWESKRGEPSPDRLDAMVWGMTELMLGSQAPAVAAPARRLRTSNPFAV